MGSNGWVRLKSINYSSESRMGKVNTPFLDETHPAFHGNQDEEEIDGL
jgi:hypothetical protein